MGTEFARVEAAWGHLQDAVRDVAEAMGCWEPWWDAATGHRDAISLLHLRHRVGDADAATYARLHWRYTRFVVPQRRAVYASDAAQFIRATEELRTALRALLPPDLLPEALWGRANDRARMDFASRRGDIGGELQ